MPAYGDDELLLVAPNVQVQVGTPLPLPPGTFPPTLPSNIFTILDIYSRKTEPIGKDTTNVLISMTKPKPPTKFLLKNYADPSAVATPAPPPPPSVVVLASPPTILLPPPPSSKSPIPDLPPNIPFDEIRYVPKDLIGVFPPYSSSPPSPPTVSPQIVPLPFPNILWDPFMKSMYESFKDFPSAIYVDEINSCISTPYFSPEAKRHRNGVVNDSRTPYLPTATYKWDMRRKADRRRVLTPRADGAIDVQPQPRNAKNAREVYLDPGIWENAVGIKNGNSLNAFSLILGIAGGAYDNYVQVAFWHIRISFGDVILDLFEGKEEARVRIQGKDPPEKVTIKPSVGSVLTTGFGDKVFILTFIPVWNGLLVSYGIPGSSDWGTSIRFIPIDKNLDINTEITNVINPPPKSDMDVPDPNYIPKTVVKRKNKRYLTPGVRIVNAKASSGSLSMSNTGPGKPSILNMGTRLKIEYYRCGGALKFVPVYFPQYSRYHFIYPGSASDKDLTTTEYVPVAPPGSSPPPPTSPPPSSPPPPSTSTKPQVKPKPKPGIKPKPPNQNVFKVPTKSQAITMPIFGYQSGSFVDFRTHLTTIVKDKQAPFACFSMEFKSVTPEVRVPMQVWGGMIVDNLVVGGGFAEVPPANQDGVLSAAAISIPRIRSVSVQRSLDGSSGDVVWDRFDPLTQQVDSRPIQEVGAIQIQVTGGANTNPGIIFTGIAYGNAEEDQPGENLIRIPLKGRESKISSEGGLGLINVPFFDGYDHRDAMAYMAVYGGFPINTNLATPFKLISSYNINNPVIDFPMGTPVSQAMDTIAQYGGALYYFDRFGTCIYIDVQSSTGTNWNYPDLALESFSDEPDSTWVRNQIMILALVAYPQPGKPLATNFENVPTQAVMLSVNLDTYPTFAWAKMAVYAIPQMVKDVNELQRQAVQIAKGQSRPRSSARCKIPGNAQIELLDTINYKWIVTSISHQVDLQRKTWSTDIGVELFIPDFEPIAYVTLAPLTPAESS
jgi:hypothetical protein